MFVGIFTFPNSVYKLLQNVSHLYSNSGSILFGEDKNMELETSMKYTFTAEIVLLRSFTWYKSDELGNPWLLKWRWNVVFLCPM